MSAIVTMFAVGINTCFSFGKKHSRFFALLLITIMWILFAGNTKNPDQINYITTYKLSSNMQITLDFTKSEPGFYFINKFFSILSNNYNVFLFEIVFICFLLIDNTVKRYTNNCNYVFICYFFYSFFLDVVQVRSFIAMSIIIFAIKYLIEDKKGNKFKFLIFLFIAGIIHYSAFLYVVLIFIKKNNKQKLVKGIIYIAFFLSILTIINNNKIPFLSTIMMDTEIISDKISNWFSNSARFGFLIKWFEQTVIFFTIILTKRITEKNINTFKRNNEKTMIYCDTIYWINFCMFILFPFYIVTASFWRLMRSIIFLNYIAYANCSDSFNNKSKEKIVYNIAIILMIIFLFFFEIIYPYNGVILKNIFEYNLIFLS